MTPIDDFDDRAWDRYDHEPHPPRRVGCQCGGDMPGRCPGPENCPMCEPLDEGDDDDEEDVDHG